MEEYIELLKSNQPYARLCAVSDMQSYSKYNEDDQQLLFKNILNVYQVFGKKDFKTRLQI